jgi:hypothetical protein
MEKIERDRPREEYIDMANGNRLKMARTDPYGFIYLSLMRGSLPEKYQGAYTDFKVARQAADQYLYERNIEEGKLERPELQTKPASAVKAQITRQANQAV